MLIPLTLAEQEQQLFPVLEIVSGGGTVEIELDDQIVRFHPKSLEMLHALENVQYLFPTGGAWHPVIQSGGPWRYFVE